MKALYPGSFDPLTFGHLDLIKRGVNLFGEVVVAVMCNPEKKPTFDLRRRILQIERSTEKIEGVTVISFQGLTVECARKNNIDLII